MASEQEFSISDPPKDKDLIEVAEKISAKLADRTELIKFGLELLEDEMVRKVKRDYPDNKNLRDMCMALLEKWEDSKDEAKWKDVVEALRKIKYRALAKIIEDAIKQPSTQAREQPAKKRPTLEEQDEPGSKKIKSTSESDNVVMAPPINSLDSQPTLPDLLKRFKGVADWNAVCPYLLNDTTGQKTKAIEKNHTDVDERRTEMLQEFLKKSNPTWRDVVRALRDGNYNNLADQIERDLQG